MPRKLVQTFLVICMFMTTAAAQSADYQLQDLDGNLHRVSDHRGKWIVINFWASWCAPCLHEMPEFERFYQAHKNNALVWGVTFEDSGKARIIDFINQIGVTYPILGYGQDPLTGYGEVKGLPTTFVINPDGLFHHRFEGPITAQHIVDVIPGL